MKEITYRGMLRSCNYSCSYCPFAKRKYSKTESQKDQESLATFFHEIEQRKEEVSILIAPYGEAMIHKYYQETLIRFSQLNQVKQIGIQTNGSFSIEEFTFLVEKLGGVAAKIHFWISFHPEMIEQKSFVEKVREISKNFPLCVGVVGEEKKLPEIVKLRREIPDKIYLWINRMDGMKGNYQPETIEQFLAIDPMFSWELKTWKAQTCHCIGQGGEALHGFYQGKGSLASCIRHLDSTARCKGNQCNCYLSYSHLNHFRQAQNFFGIGAHLRIPKVETYCKE